MKPRYHVYVGERRTTVSLDAALEALLVLRLGKQPGTRAAHRAVQRWLQAQLDEHDDPGRLQVSQWLQSQVIFEIADASLDQQYTDWRLATEA